MTFGNVALERAAIESTYEGLCTVTNFQTVKDPVSKVTGPQRALVFENEPCALSQTALSSSSKTGTDNTVSFNAKLFISPDVTIEAGSEIYVEQNGMRGTFKRVGKPFRYTTHQEISLEEIDRA